jgi:hypothetical protein
MGVTSSTSISKDAKSVTEQGSHSTRAGNTAKKIDDDDDEAPSDGLKKKEEDSS